MSARWQAYPDAAAAAEACARHIIGILEQVPGDRATFAISGGHTPKLLFEALARSGFPWDKVHFFWVDERCVPPTDPASNYRLADECLFIPARVPRRNLHRIEGELRPPDAAQRYVEDIRNSFGPAPGEVPHFDVMHLGMGPEGHTASLFPNSPALDDRETIAAAVSVPAAVSPWRVTLMPAVLLAARHTMFLVPGADKAEAVRTVFHGDYDPKRCPAQIVSRNAPSVAWFLDQPAARLIG